MQINVGVPYFNEQFNYGEGLANGQLLSPQLILEHCTALGLDPALPLLLVA